MGGKYILNEHEPAEEPDLMKWSRWYETADRHVDKTTIDGVTVSTTFLGLDHRFGGEGPPILFETMIFGGEHDEYQERYLTWQEAEQGHARAVALVRAERVKKLADTIE